MQQQSIFPIPENCPVCGLGYAQENKDIVSKENGMIIIHSTCSGCRVSSISNVTIDGAGISAIGMLTDISKKDLDLLKKKGALEIDDVLEIYDYIKKEGRLNF